MRFRTTVRQSGRTATGIPVPDEVVEKLAAGRKPAVTVTVNGHTYRSTVATMAGEFMIGLSAENRAVAGVAGGDEIDVDVELDTAPREVTVPPDLAEALAADIGARAFFESLSYSKQRWFVLSVEGAKKPETRTRRVDDALTKLRAGKSR